MNYNNILLLSIFFTDFFDLVIFIQETQLEYAVKDILSLSNADDYIPRFAQHKISIETMGKLTDEDLRRVNVIII